MLLDQRRPLLKQNKKVEITKKVKVDSEITSGQKTYKTYLGPVKQITYQKL